MQVKTLGYLLTFYVQENLMHLCGGSVSVSGEMARQIVEPGVDQSDLINFKCLNQG